MITIVTATTDREDIAFATKMAEKYGFDKPTDFLNDLLNTAMRQVMAGEKWSSDETDRYYPRSAAHDLDDGIPF